MTDTIHTYNTWYEFVRAADTGTSINPQRNSAHKADRQYSARWSGTNTWDETMQLASRGWPEGLKRIREHVHIIERFISPKQPRLELTYSVRGPGVLDFDRYAQGRPDTWVVWNEIDTQDGQSGRIVPIVFNLSTSSGVNPDTMFQRGAAVVALIDILEHSGIRCEVLLSSCGINQNNTYTFNITLKKSGEALDLDRLAFAMCNASTFRRLVFSLMEQNIPRLESGYGHVSTYREDGAINLDSASLRIRDESNMVPWLIQQLAGYGVEVDK